MNTLAKLDEVLGPWIENGMAIAGTTVMAVAAWIAVCEALAEVMS